MPASGRLLSVGHSNGPLEPFVARLLAAGVTALADLRSTPRSRYAVWFDAASLRDALRSARIAYVPMGAQLGGRPADDRFYDGDGHLRYDRLASSGPVQAGLARLERGVAQGHVVALLCSEEDPAGCHRRLLVARLLTARGQAVDHLRGDGRVQSEEQLLAEISTRGRAERDRLATAWQRWRSLRPLR